MFLPVKLSETDGNVDFVVVSGDAYVDHPSFGHAIISRLTESEGFTIGMVCQPVCDADYLEFGRPNIGFMVTSGVVDSMVNNYTAAKRKRNTDYYSEGGRAGRRPDRALTVYCRNIRRLFPGTHIIVGGIEASLRRFAHYDYWSDSVKPSVLADTGADLLVYGMGERPLRDILALAKKGVSVGSIKDVRGTAYLSEYDKLSAKIKEEMSVNVISFCPSYEDIKADKIKYIKAFKLQCSDKKLAQKHGMAYVIQNPPASNLTEREMDAVYALPFMRAAHPMYEEGVPAIIEVKYSITSHRGCMGSCSYCALNYHQGRNIQKRSIESILNEVDIFVKDSEFKGYIHDVGGPTANFREALCTVGGCKDKSCVGETICKNLKVSHAEYVKLLKGIRQKDGVKKEFIRSGIRFDYLMKDKNDEFFHELVKHHVSGQLKVAPEHCVSSVLKRMNKPDITVYKAFRDKFYKITAKHKEQYLVPYFISSHPGCTLKDAVKLSEFLKETGSMPEQVQDFYPTPSTRSTTEYYTELDIDTLKPIYVAKSEGDKRKQRALLQYRKKENYEIIRDALIEADREDLIGYDKKCLIKPKQ